jgi:hypothetical protein
MPQAGMSSAALLGHIISAVPKKCKKSVPLPTIVGEGTGFMMTILYAGMIIPKKVGTKNGSRTDESRGSKTENGHYSLPQTSQGLTVSAPGSAKWL